ncbi:hypothetical protein CV102_05220 [Natronococcus pandeyae]|uniref:Uncharacterized protein n=1 Tax=Natronococcus pandeyae TaxID=2055836 RepID=A0A8J8Q8D6_9EURY|nr:hypothetical protein CV102_05220 [Natronococcus pandeyae]
MVPLFSERLWTVPEVMADRYFDGSFPGDPTPTPSFQLESREGVGVGSAVDGPVEALVSPRAGSSDGLDREFEG